MPCASSHLGNTRGNVCAAATSSLMLNAAPDGKTMACSAIPFDASLAALGLGLLALARRRARPSAGASATPAA